MSKITIEKARKLLGKRGKEMDDESVRRIIDKLFRFAEYFLDIYQNKQQ